MEISGNIVDVLHSRIFAGTLVVRDGRIIHIESSGRSFDTFILPGLVDSHIHIESSLLVPSEFARLAVTHGTVASVSDPHEIGNVLGIEGVRYMIENGKRVPFKFFFGVPSCVPATAFESSGARLGPDEVEQLLKLDEIRYLSEMMNFPGVLNDDAEVMAKIRLAKKYRKPIDGHAPGLRGASLEKYIQAGISTDHETFELEEGREKLEHGMKLLIREGSAARNFEVLYPLIEEYPDRCMFCTDDIHPHDLVRGHINDLVKRALRRGIDRMKVLRVACVNPVKHYNLDVGLLQQNDPADFVVIDSFEDFTILQTYVNGQLVSRDGQVLLERVAVEPINNFNTAKKEVADFALKRQGERINVIEIIENQLITNRISARPTTTDGNVISNPAEDILKFVVVNRYTNSAPAIGFLKHFGLEKGALASSVAHDSHNILAVGVTDEEICEAVNLVIGHRGGLCVVSGEREVILPLPVGGLMTTDDGIKVAREYVQLEEFAKELGSSLASPFMTLSFMALLVIPRLKLSDKGLFDVEKFEFISVFE